MSTEHGYWTAITRDRLGRRRLLKSSAALGVGAAALSFIGCGGSDSKSSGGDAKPGASSLAAKPTDTTSKAVKGGVYTAPINADPNAFDVISGFAPDVPHPARVYSRIVKYQSYKYPDPVQPVAAGDAASSWETSPDGMTVTYKLRPGQKFDPRPPTNGRVMTAQDMKYSAERFAKISPQRNVLMNAASPDAAIASFEAPDNNTFVVKLAFPYAPINMLLGAWRYIIVMPVESESGYDIRNDMRGSGAWRLKSYLRGSNYTYERNPDWYDADKVRLDGHELPATDRYVGPGGAVPHRRPVDVSGAAGRCRSAEEGLPAAHDDAAGELERRRVMDPLRLPARLALP